MISLRFVNRLDSLGTMLLLNLAPDSSLIETKNRAIELSKRLEEELKVDMPVRIHWTGCPNSCGQAQVADIGLMVGWLLLD
mmetsp:Transcript_26294/g.44063  ORF Transcript_26294/g.44063 Transcript_26294/m.44063 type:complete len:81 (-) Transcript_26294:812-1054(-)